jgi:hypothetical protein
MWAHDFKQRTQLVSHCHGFPPSLRAPAKQSIEQRARNMDCFVAFAPRDDGTHMKWARVDVRKTTVFRDATSDLSRLPIRRKFVDSSEVIATGVGTPRSLTD